ncbi:alanine racemase [Paenibacillus montanisoli]|uniref:Amino acid processing protein n=1 Tax=Paenibacillus montanisoli TaxID=2081970 RepID=A0A328U165_9BACL|nr:alanine racemase [Paenibacillus montanisoli]RAP75191.1 amino acid processing protein [Paenibacillus montanisoli]
METQWDTPAVLVDLDVLERNISAMADKARQAGVKLRPHVKTHKSVWIAKQQLRYGAAGITVAKLGEAEIMADAGISDILIAYPIVGKPKLERLGRLTAKAAVTVSTDDPLTAKGLSDLGEFLKRPIRLYVDVNTGLNRCGREPGEQTAALVKHISRMPGVTVAGLMTHAGHSYGKPDAEEVRAIARNEAESLVQTQRMLQREGIEIEEISVGSTPTSMFIGELTGVTEMRPGTYVFGDGIQLSLGSMTNEQCAVHVAVTVVGHPREGTYLVDGGSKTFSSDLNAHRSGYGILRDNPDVYIERMNEEHGWLHVPPGVRFQIGEQLHIVPNHVCPMINLHERLIGVRGGQAEHEIAVDARGKIT